MKKFFFLLAMMTMTMAANAQFEEGKNFLGVSASGFDLSYNGSNKFKLGLDAQLGTFVKDNCLVYGQLGYQHIGEPKANNLRLGVGGRYYILQNGIFLGANLNYVHGTPSYDDFKPAIEVGYCFFVSHSMTIEPALYYEQSFKDHSNYSTVGLKVGFGIYHQKNKIINSVVNGFKD